MSGSLACRRRRSSVDSTPPRLVACTQSRVRPASRSAAAAPPASSIATIAPKPRICAAARLPGSPGSDGCRTRATAGCADEPPASSAALAPARSTRRCRVRRPRRASHASAGPGDRAVHGAVAVQPPASAASRGDRGAEHDVGVAGQVLGHRVHDDVRAVVERPLHQRRREGVVDGHQRAARVPPGGDQRGQVGDLEHRVGRGLEPEQVGAGRQGGADGVRVVHVHPARRAAGRARPASPSSVRVPLYAAGGATTRPPSGHLVEHRGDGRHPRAEQQRAATLERAQRGLEGLPGRVRPAAVAEVARLRVAPARGDVRRREHDGLFSGAFGSGRRAAGGDGDRRWPGRVTAAG